MGSGFPSRLLPLKSLFVQDRSQLDASVTKCPLTSRLLHHRLWRQIQVAYKVIKCPSNSSQGAMES